jgi:Na+-transporting NADH:ubiquinone oxidoreductase subunit B
VETYLRGFFDKNKRHFTNGGRLSGLSSLFEAVETVFFTPAIAAAKAPYVRDGIDLKRFMSMVLLALVPPLLFGIYNTGYQSLAAGGHSPDFLSAMMNGLAIVMPLVIVSYGVGFFWEALFSAIRKHSISEGFLVTGLLFPMILPPTVPLWQVAVGISFGVVIGKEVFGGTGRNIFNPALTGRAFLFFAYPAKMSGDNVWVAVSNAGSSAVSAISGATPLSITTLAPGIKNFEAQLEQAGFGLMDLFIGFYPGCVADTSALCCLIGAVILIVTGVASYRIILGGVAGLLITSFGFGLISQTPLNPWMTVNPLYHLVAGGFAFGIVYMATDPVSAPGATTSKWVYGICIGALTVMIRVVNPAFPEGVMLAILFMNLFSPVFDVIEIRVRSAKRIPNV